MRPKSYSRHGANPSLLSEFGASWYCSLHGCWNRPGDRYCLCDPPTDRCTGVNQKRHVRCQLAAGHKGAHYCPTKNGALHW